MMKIEITISPSISDIKTLGDRINEDYSNYATCESFGVFLRDTDKQIIGGCNGNIIYGAIYTDQLWIHKNLRNMGYGKTLMMEVEKLGISKSCTIATVTTMSFQAKEFYEKLGYKVDFERHGYINGSSCIFLSKKLLAD